jgi:dihydrofolate reductase
MNKFSVITCHDRNRGIGKDNKMPWHHSADMKHFKETTEHSNVIMGRNTWDSLPERYRPLPKRTNIVISSKDLDLPEGVILARSLDEALEVNTDDGIYVIGGQQLYTAALKHPRCGGLFITKIDAQYDCDTFFPLYEHRFEESMVIDEDEENGIKYEIYYWENLCRKK